MVRVVTFGAFDPLHEGHRWLFTQARAQGDHLTVVVARDEVIAKTKRRPAHQPETERLSNVSNSISVDEAILGDVEVHSYNKVKSLKFSVLVLGYDQLPSDEEVEKILQEQGKTDVKIVRLPPFKPEIHKSSFLRS